MRTLFLAILLGLSSFAGADVFCTAVGFTSNWEERQVSGDYCATQEQAEKDALRVCRSYGLMSCEVRSCFDLGNTSEDL